ncbi:uncharacterized protein ACHE_11905A [Aspergillus chevalieri]|uniref:DUF6314 domain-containing protein n=1 Tax=Aspergillus chevalieri TaxID=182096 RepID=A0A7R7VII9_ASPCH|nr:uncharacterized protein ACHE_11905A [Aspergillus chevalieri]BCR84503.1 hypothetical protein ACHE_11905A [Aspergillus chevalieri]
MSAQYPARQSPSPNPATMPPRQLSTLFTSLSRESRRWSLTRILHSNNPMDIQGELRGTATFKPLERVTGTGTGTDRDMVYREEGEMPSTVGMGMAGLRWSKKYIWRLSEGGEMSVWFVKVGGSKGSDEEEADYLFHKFDFKDGSAEDSDAAAGEDMFVAAPVPPAAVGDTAVLTARGNHLCINDMYRTAYAFRIRPESGEVLSWSSRHVVKGPKKDQDIVNVYEST